MKRNEFIKSQNRPAVLASISGRQFLASFIALFTATVIVGSLALASPALSQTTGTKLRPGNIVFTDSGDGVQGGFILKVDPQTGQESTIAHGGYLGFFGYPNGVVVDRQGQLIVANEACLLRIAPNTGGQTLIRDAQGAPGLFWGLALDHNGDILVAAEKAILRVHPQTGQMQVVSSGGYLTVVLSIAVGQNGELFVTNVRYVADVGWVGEIIGVNPRDRSQTVISQAGYLTFLLGIAVNGNDIYVTGRKGHDQNFGIGQVTHVDARTGIQRVVAQGGNLVRPVGIAVDANGQLVVADPYTVNPESPYLSSGGYDGAIIRIDPANGEQAVIARGQGSCINPCGVAIVPAFAMASPFSLPAR